MEHINHLMKLEVLCNKDKKKCLKLKIIMVIFSKTLWFFFLHVQ